MQQTASAEFVEWFRSMARAMRSVWAPIAGCLLVQIPWSQGFGPAQVLTDQVDGPMEAVLADVDGDGDLDAVFASREDDRVAWVENTDGLGTFGPLQIISTAADGPTAVLAIDLDGDGDPDVVSGSGGDDEIAWYENTDGLGTFGPQQIISIAVDDPRSLCAADLDGDGDPDLLSASELDDKVAWYENTDGLGTFGPQNIITTAGSSPWSVVAADLDGDGDPDVLSAASLDNRVAWFENVDGQGSFGPQKTITASALAVRSVFTADLDGDGDQDVLSASQYDHTVAWYENTSGAGSFGPEQIINASGFQALAVSAADLDRDGDQDVLSVFIGSPLAVVWQENEDGLGKFGPAQVIEPSNHGNDSVVTGDINGDGDLDLLAPQNLADTINWYENLRAPVVFGPPRNLTSKADSPTCIRTADLDGDGDQDALATSSLDGKLAWYENTDGLGSFGLQRVITTEAQFASSCDAADLDGDGDQDALSASSGDGRIAWYENTDGRGTFGGQRIISASSLGAKCVHARDLDGDGDSDVLAASIEDDTIAWYENTDGQGTFGAARILTSTADGAYSVSAADLDGDGDPDVLSASTADDTLAWFENTDGQGSFGPQRVISSTADGARSVVAADLDGDGDRDVLSASYDSSRIAWHANTDGLGGFGPEQLITTSAGQPSSVVAEDLDGDGDLDVASASSWDDKVAWYENTDGLGSFGLQQILTTEADGATAVWAADLDGDGDCDVLSASVTDDENAWYENLDGQGTFGPQQLFTATADAVVCAFAADLDGDGDKDVLSASTGDDKIAWYENTDGLGTFGHQQIVADQALGAAAVSAADLDGDGDDDVLSASRSDDRIAWYENTDGLGGFGPGQTITASAQGACEVLATDLDGDGDADVVSGSSDDNKLAWYENLMGLGTFGPAQVVTLSAHSLQSVHAADLDGDGDPDLLSASFLDDEVAWYENHDGQGSFGLQQTISGSTLGAISVCTADLDGDGDLDVLSAASKGDAIAWHANTDGSGGFGPGQLISTYASHPSSVSSADLDGDGDRDVLSASSWDDEVAWYENADGLGAFGSQRIIEDAADSAAQVLTADLDGDGDEDVLSVSWEDDTVAWFENLHTALMADVDGISLAAGGTQQLTLIAGPEQGLRPYLLLGSASGTSPGLSLNGLLLPLNPDVYFVYTLSNPNSPGLANSFGFLSSKGTASATLELPQGLNPGFAGSTLHHAFCVLDLSSLPGAAIVSFVSNAVPLNLLP